MNKVILIIKNYKKIRNHFEYRRKDFFDASFYTIVISVY